MKRNLPLKYLVYLFLVMVLFFFLRCGGQPGPRKVAMEFIEAVYASDSTAILKYVDFEQIARERMGHLPEEEQLKNLDQMKQQLYRSLLMNGSVRAKWNSYRIVVANETVRGDSAWVDVTFMRKETGTTRYTQMVLDKKEGFWKIVSYVE